MERSEGNQPNLEKSNSSIVVQRPKLHCYILWRDLEDLADYIPMLEGIRAPLGQESVARQLSATLRIDQERFECELIVTEDIEAARISWRTSVESPITHRGTVEFKSLGTETTEVTLTLEQPQLKGGGEPNAAALALERFKTLAEHRPEELVDSE